MHRLWRLGPGEVSRGGELRQLADLEFVAELPKGSPGVARVRRAVSRRGGVERRLIRGRWPPTHGEHCPPVSLTALDAQHGVNARTIHLHKPYMYVDRLCCLCLHLHDTLSTNGYEGLWAVRQGAATKRVIAGRHYGGGRGRCYRACLCAPGASRAGG